MKKTHWDLSILLSSENQDLIDEKQKIVSEMSYKFINKWKDREDYLKNPLILLEALSEYEEWASNYGPDGDIGYYFWLKSSLDQADSKIKAKLNQITDFATKIENDIQFFTLRIAKLSESTQKLFLANNGLQKYKHFLENLFDEAKYLLTEPEEKIMNLKETTSHSNWTKMTSTFISKEEMKVLDESTEKMVRKNFSEITSLMNSPKENIRDSAAKAFNKIQKKYAEVAEHELNSILQDKKINDELRNLTRPDEGRHISDDISTEIVDALVLAVSNRFSISQDFYKLKAKLMGVNKLEYHERNVPYGKVEKSYKYEHVIDLINSVVKKLDHEFSNIFVQFIEGGQIDVFPKKGKVHGAFCVHGTIKQPTYILLNHTDKLTDVLTLAHELGHGINNELIRKSQNGINFGTPLSTAEVASTFMEDFVLEEILKESDDELRLSILMMKLNDDVSTIFRQIACYKFEQELHKSFRQSGYLSKEDIGKLFQKHMSAYMGDFVEQSKGSENWWVYWKHIRSFFYVYSYASGLLISKSLQNYVKKDRKYIEKVKKFMSAGLSKSPQEIFLELGIDISKNEFWDNGLSEIENLLSETKALSEKLKKYNTLTADL